MQALLEQAGVRATPRTMLTVEGVPLLGIEVPGAEAIATWEKLRAVAPAAGLWPLVVGAEGELPAEDELAEPGPRIAEILEEAACVFHGLRAAERRAEVAEPEGPGRAIAAWITEHPAGGDERSLRAALDVARPALACAPPELAGWDLEVAPQGGFTIPFDILSREPLESVVILLVPTPRAWEVPAWLGFGGWNACPRPEEHVARLRRWHDAFGAELVGLSHDVVELAVARPPLELEACARLAAEQHAYCGDIVYQGFGSLERLAGSLRGAKTWYFWWD